MYFQDNDGNIILDFASQGVPLGYSHPDFLARMTFNDKSMLSLSDIFPSDTPPIELYELAREVLTKKAPRMLNEF